nr:hypothetical protein [Micromonospora sp. DSM 115978]
MSPDSYCDLVSERTREILSEGAPPGYPVPVAATWTVALEQLNNPAAITLLKLWSFFGQEPIPTHLFDSRYSNLLPADLVNATTDSIRLAKLIELISGLGL